MVNNAVSGSIAGVAIAGPMWVSKVAEFSSLGTLALQVLGGIWLLVQITRALITWPSKD